MAPTSGNPKVQKKEPPPLPPLKRLRPPEREEEEKRFPYGLPREKEERRGPVSGEDEGAGVDRPRRKERQVTGDLRRTMDLGYNLSPEDVPGDVVRERFWDSGTGRVVCVSKLSRRLARIKSEPAAEERAWRDRAAETEERAELKRARSEG